ncbi:hypothetical protein LPJ74_006501, partial [Coemansia sp. RSA 1843]
KSFWVAGSVSREHQPNITPRVQRASHANSHTNSGVSMFTLQKEHDLEAEIAAQKIVDQNVPGVAIPRNEGARSRADEISGVVVSAFESYVASTPYHTRLVAQNNSGLAAMQSEKPDPFIDIGVFSDECKAIREMIRGKGRGRGKEKPKQCTSKIFRPPVRQIAPLKHTDKIPESAGAQDRIGIVLRVEGDTSSDSPYRGSMKLDYLRMLALIEAKRCNNSQLQQDAYAQLFKYSRHIYASRYDRRFLVNMALCEKDKLGYDPTLYFSRDEDRWEIKVHDDSAGGHNAFLIEINDTLKANRDLKGKYPNLLAGCAVRMADKSGKSADDTVDTSFAGLRNNTLVQLTFRIQK